MSGILQLKSHSNIKHHIASHAQGEEMNRETKDFKMEQQSLATTWTGLIENIFSSTFA